MRISIPGEDIVRTIFIGVLLFLTFQIWEGKEPYILHSINLVFHEAGHVFFLFFSDFIHFLGGTLGQLLIPLMIGIHFLRHTNLFGTYVALWWLGTNFVDVGLYMADARVQLLPLVGGEHDWYYLFATMNVLEKDQLIGQSVSIIGYTLMIAALMLALSQIGIVRDLVRGVEK